MIKNIADNYGIRHYGNMINDRVRTSAYVEALRRVIQPDSVVLDIGTGPGIFAFMACQFGAARVYAIEADDAIEVARQCASHVPGADRIVWIKGFSSEIELPERVDVIVGDLHGTLPLYNQNVAALIDARLRHLKPGGHMIPQRDRLYAVPAQAPHEYATLDSPWSRNEYGIDLSAGRTFVGNAWWRARPEPVDAEQLLASPSIWGEIEYIRTQSTDLEGVMEWRVERAGVLHGFYVWFDCETADSLQFSNAPNLPETIYGRAFFPVFRAVDVVEDDRVITRMSATRVASAYVFRWNTRVTDSAGDVKADFKQTTFNDRPLSLDSLRPLAADHIPTLSVDGNIAHAILGAMAQCQPLGAIAVELCARFPYRFSDVPDALNHVATLSAEYGRAA